MLWLWEFLSKVGPAASFDLISYHRHHLPGGEKGNEELKSKQSALASVQYPSRPAGLRLDLDPRQYCSSQLALWPVIIRSLAG